MAKQKLPTGITAQKDCITIRFTVKGVDYRETLYLPPTKINLTTVAVTERARMIAHVREHGSLKKMNVPTVAEYLDKWVRLQPEQIGGGTLHQYRRYAERLKAVFGEIPVDELTVGDVRDFCAEMAANKRTGKTIANTISPLRMALGVAVDDGVIANNVIKDWSFKTKRSVEDGDDIKPFSKEEQAKILEQCLPHEWNYYMFMIWSGLRPSEAIALTWDDIDFKKKTISINKAKTQYVQEAESPKTRGSKRVIKMLTNAREALIRQMRKRGLHHTHVFINPDTDKPYNSSKDFYKRWVRILKSAGVEYRKQYQCRHTFASMMVSSGEHPQWVADMMGHTDWTMIAKTYAKWMPEAMPDAGSKAEKLFG